MANKKSQWVWAQQPKTPKMNSEQKKEMLGKIKIIIEKLPKLSKKVSRIDIKGNRIYFYGLMNQEGREGAHFIKELIDGKYVEFMYGRITLKDEEGQKCSLDCQRYNDQWMTLYEGELTKCITVMENDEGWFT